MTRILYIPTGNFFMFPPENASTFRKDGATINYEDSHYYSKYSYTFKEFFNLLVDGGFPGLELYNDIFVKGQKPLREEFELIEDKS